MADLRDYDLLDEVNCAASCEAVADLCGLVDKLVKDIQHLELECISTRYLLSLHLDGERGELLRMDILADLGRRFGDDAAYTLYKNLMYDGGDPMEFREYLDRVREAGKGKLPCWH